MATLKSLQSAIEAGQTVQKVKYNDGYEAVQMENGKYVSIHMFERETFETFESLLDTLESDYAYDIEMGHSEFHDIWEIEDPPTEDELAIWQPFVDAIKAGDEQMAGEVLAENFKEHMTRTTEVMLFQTRNQRVRKTLLWTLKQVRTRA